MKKTALIFTLFMAAAAAFASVETGSKAPDFTLTDTKGVSHNLSDFAGKYVILEWTNHQCPFVVKHYKNGDMQALQKEMTEEGAVWLQIVSSAPGKQGHISPSEGETLRTERQMHSTAMLLDENGAVGRAYDARTTPHTYLIDPSGTLIYQGAIDSIKSTRPADVSKATNYLKAAFASVQAGKPIEKATTKAYGCSVKY